MITIETFRPEHLAQMQTLVNVHLGALVPGWAVPEVADRQPDRAQPRRVYRRSL